MRGREILDSRGNPTVEVEVRTENGHFGRASVPSGASTGKREAVEIRDGGKRYLGKGVLNAVRAVNTEIRDAIVGMDATEQVEIDKTLISLDGTPNKSRLGANAILATSLAVCRAAADALKKPLYAHIADIVRQVAEVAEVKADTRSAGTNPTDTTDTSTNTTDTRSADSDAISPKRSEHTVSVSMPTPMFNVINGGVHAGNELSIQEFLIIPAKIKHFRDKLRAGSEIYHVLKRILERKYGKSATNVGDEGGYAPPMSKTEEALDALSDAISEAGYENEVMIGMDAAASTFYDERSDSYAVDGKTLKGDELTDFYCELVKKYPIMLIEDPYEENSFRLFADLTAKLPHIIIVGDDLFVTSVKRLREGIEKGAANAILLKLNQVGTLTETISASILAEKCGYKRIVSHRSGETEDTFIADFAVGIHAEFIKSGAPARGERTCKYNQLLRIEEQIETQ